MTISFLFQWSLAQTDHNRYSSSMGVFSDTTWAYDLFNNYMYFLVKWTITKILWEAGEQWRHHRTISCKQYPVYSGFSLQSKIRVVSHSGRYLRFPTLENRMSKVVKCKHCQPGFLPDSQAFRYADNGTFFCCLKGKQDIAVLTDHMSAHLSTCPSFRANKMDSRDD